MDTLVVTLTLSQRATNQQQSSVKLRNLRNTSRQRRFTHCTTPRRQRPFLTALQHSPFGGSPKFTWAPSNLSLLSWCRCLVCEARRPCEAVCETFSCAAHFRYGGALFSMWSLAVTQPATEVSWTDRSHRQRRASPDENTYAAFFFVLWASFVVVQAGCAGNGWCSLPAPVFAPVSS